MFNQGTSSNTKIAVLEERLSSYELMLKKIDEAIQIMGKTSQNISKMLAVHEQKIEHCGKSDDMIISMIHDLKEENGEQHEAVSVRIKSLESKIEEIAKFRWIIVGSVVVISFVFSQSPTVIDILTPNNSQIQLEKNK
jgi:chromosome segregation ATPase